MNRKRNSNNQNRRISRSYRLPNRAITEDKEEYLRIWHNLGKRVEQALNRANPYAIFKMCAFDPDIQVVNMEREIEGIRRVINLPLEVVKALIK